MNNSRCFRKYEGKLALDPIDSFMLKNSQDLSGKIIDIGCGKMPYKHYFTSAQDYIGIDKQGTEADIIADACETPLADGEIDVVICNQVIEHLPEPDKLIVELSRVLKPRGVLLLSAPQMGRLHGEPNDFYRFTKWGLKYILEQHKFTNIKISSHGGFFRALGSHVNFFIVEKLAFNKYLKFFLRRTIISFNNKLFAFLDKFILWDKDTLGYNVYAEKESLNG